MQALDINSTDPDSRGAVGGPSGRAASVHRHDWEEEQGIDDDSDDECDGIVFTGLGGNGQGRAQ
jgi:hypothetical protein